MQYIKIEEQRSLMSKKIGGFFIICSFLLPQYFGIQIAGFDLTVQRMAMILLTLFILENNGRSKSLFYVIKKSLYSPYILLYLVVVIYTGILRANINTILNQIIEIYCLYLMIYIVTFIFGIEEFLKLLSKLLVVLCLLGIVEYFLQRTPFSYLETIPGLYTGGGMRSGSYRIMGPCNHSLAYGLLLVAMAPISCINLKDKSIDLGKHLFLFLLITINIILTGSRSTLAVFGVECILLLMFIPKEKVKKVTCYLVLSLLSFVLILLLISQTSFGKYVLMQFTSIIDEIFGTTLASKYGADIEGLANSTNYRKLLPQIFTLSWLNPLLGRGSAYSMGVDINGYYIRSIDNYYVAMYIRYAYPGLVSYVLILLKTLISTIKSYLKMRDGWILAILIGIAGYYLNLWWLDSLQTLKYVYILFAIYQTYYFINCYEIESLRAEGGLDYAR